MTRPLIAGGRPGGKELKDETEGVLRDCERRGEERRWEKREQRGNLVEVGRRLNSSKSRFRCYEQADRVGHLEPTIASIGVM
jgi:hypothetical protein